MGTVSGPHPLCVSVPCGPWSPIVRGPQRAVPGPGWFSFPDMGTVPERGLLRITGTV